VAFRTEAAQSSIASIGKLRANAEAPLPQPSKVSRELTINRLSRLIEAFF
jgi:hypothetical protein